MKICIFSLALHSNYGGILQAYALQTVLQRMGHEVIVINKILTASKPRLIEIIKRMILKILGRDVVVFSERKRIREAPIVNKSLLDFRRKYIHEVFIDNLCDIRQYDIDCIVVGSDQIWRAKYFKEQWSEQMENAFLSFTKGWNVKRISYAASFGVNEWDFDNAETERILDAIKQFNAVSVREESGVNLLRDKQIDSKVVLDPTLLLSKDDYVKLFETAHVPQSKGNILVYLLDPKESQKRVINKLEAETHLVSFFVNNKGISETAPVEDRILPSVETWLRGFYDAEYIITDSFHACVFSIIFNKPFVVFGNKVRGLSRFESLLSQFGLMSCLMDENATPEDVTNLLLSLDKKMTVYSTIQEALQQKKDYSIKFLNDALF